MNIIDRREKYLEMRKKKKTIYDSLYNLSATKSKAICLSSTMSNSKVRLLDEGFVLDAYGEPEFYLAKGTCKKFYDNLPDDFVGHYDLGHMPFESHPLLLGCWSKKDLTLVDTENGRQALDVDVHLNEDLNVVQDLKKMDFDLCVSVEMGCKYNEEMSEEMGCVVYDNIDITGIGIVGNPGNVNSTGLRLNVEKGNDMNELEKKLQSLEDKLDKVLNLDEEDKEEIVEENEEIVEEKDEVIEEETDDDEEEVKDDEEVKDENLSEILSAIKALKTEIAELRTENKELKTELGDSKKREKEFLDSITLSVGELAKKKEEKIKTTKPVYTDGIC